MRTLRITALCCLMAGSVMAGTVQQNLGFDPNGSFVVKQDAADAVSSAWNYASNNIVLLGQSFSLTNETTLRAVTLLKSGDGVYSDGTNDLYLWIGEFSTNGTIVSTNLQETFDLTGITLSNNSYFSLNLDADLILPSGDYAFQFWTEEGAESRLSIQRSDPDVYDGGIMLRKKNPPSLPTGAADYLGDITFALHSEVVGVVSNVAPFADSQNVSTVPNVNLPITLTGMDPDGVTNLTYTLVDFPTNGNLTGAAPDLAYEPDTDFQGLDHFTFTVDDGVYVSAPATVTITVTNEPPNASPQALSTLQDTAIDITLAGNDPEGSNLTYMVIDLPTNGMVSATDTNFLTYTPNNGYAGTDSFTFKVNDGVHDSEVATVSIDVLALGTSLTFNSLSADFTTASNLLNVAGSADGLSVTGAVVSGGDMLYSVSYTDMDLDGDTLSDTISFDVRVAGVSGASYTFSTTSGVSSATIGSTSVNVADGTGFPYAYNPSQKAWCARSSATGMLGGDTLIFTVENINISGTAGPLDGSFVGFEGVVLAERAGSAHQTILGSGAGLDGYQWDGPSLSVTNFTMNPFYVTQAVTSGAGLRYGVSTVDLTFNISSTAPPSSVGDVSYQLLPGGTQIALSWPTEAGFYYGVESTDNLVGGTWSNAATTVLGTGGEVIITNDITEDRQFYRSYLVD